MAQWLLIISITTIFFTTMRLSRGLLALFASISLLVKGASAENIVLTWDKNTEIDLKGYRVAFGTQSGVYTDELDIANHNWTTIGGLTGGMTYYFVVVAYNTEGYQGMP